MAGSTTDSRREPGTEATVRASAGTSSRFGWAGLLLAAFALVVVPLGVYLVLEAHDESTRFRRHAEQSLETSARIVDDWIGAQIDAARREHCDCKLDDAIVGSKRGPPKAATFCRVEASAVRTDTSEPTAEVAFRAGKLEVNIERASPCPVAVVAAGSSTPPAAQVSDGPVTRVRKLTELSKLLATHLEDTGILEGLLLQFSSEDVLRIGRIPNATQGPQPRPGKEAAAELLEVLPSATKSPAYVGSLSIGLAAMQPSPADSAKGARQAVLKLHGFAEDGFEPRLFRLSGAHVFVLALAALLLALGWPAVKVWLLGPMDRLAYTDVLLLFVGFPIAIAVAVMFFKAGLLHERLEQETFGRLRYEARQLNETLDERFDEFRALVRRVSRAVVDEQQRPLELTAAHGFVGPASALGCGPLPPSDEVDTWVLAPLLAESIASLCPHAPRAPVPVGCAPDSAGVGLPFCFKARHLIGHSRDGSQLVKVGFAGMPTPPFNYADRPYFASHVGDRLQAADTVAQVIRSRANGENSLIVSASAPSPDAIPPAAVWALGYTLDAVPSSKRDNASSLRRWPDAGVALVRSDGEVVMHSSLQRIWSENLFDSTNVAAQLKTLTSGGSTVAPEFAFDYYGRSHFGVIEEFQPKEVALVGEDGREQWHTLLFSSVDPVRGVVTDALLAALALLGLLLIVQLAHGAVHHLVFRSRGQWLWPGGDHDSKRRWAFGIGTMMHVGLCLALPTLTLKAGFGTAVAALALAQLVSFSGSKVLLSNPRRSKLTGKLLPEFRAALAVALSAGVTLASMLFGLLTSSRWVVGIVVLSSATAYLLLGVELRPRGLARLTALLPARRRPDVIPSRATSGSGTSGHGAHRWLYVGFLCSGALLPLYTASATFEQVSRAEAAAYEQLSWPQPGLDSTAAPARIPAWVAATLERLPFVGTASERVRAEAIELARRSPIESVSSDMLLTTWGSVFESPIASTTSGELRRTTLSSWQAWSLFGILALGAGLISAVTRRVFGLGLQNVELRTSTLPARPSLAPYRLLLGASAAAGVESWLKTSVTEGERLERCSLLAGDMALDNLLELAPHLDARAVHWVIDGCEQVLDNSALRQRLLAFLQRAVSRTADAPQWRVTLLSERDLLAHLSERETEFAQAPIDRASLVDGHEVQRWSMVLGHFAVASGSERPLPPAPAGLRTFLEAELSWDPYLQRLIEPLSAEAADKPENEVLGLVVVAAKPRFRYLWGLCTPREKLLLLRLAQEGFVNPHHWVLARKLRARGLLDFGPGFRFRARSFEIFVSRALAPQTVREWERTHLASQWHRTSVGLALLLLSLAGVLALGYPELFDSRPGVAITTLLGWFLLAGRLTLLQKALRAPEALASLGKR